MHDEAVFHTQPVGSSTVVRRSELDPNGKVVDYEKWTRPVTSDPTTDRIVMVVADAPGCQEVVLQSSMVPVYSTCTWDLKRLSSDGRHAVGLSPEFGWGVVNLVNSTPVLIFGEDDAVDADSFQFDGSEQLNFVVRHAGLSAIATCTLDDRRCWQASPWSSTPYILVQPNWA